MAQHSHVPTFGNWENKGEVPYTAYFDKARKGRNKGKIINPNDPEDNPNIVPSFAAAKATPPRGKIEGVERNHERQKSRENGDFTKYNDSPARSENTNRKASESANPPRGKLEGVERNHERQKSRENGDFTKYNDSPARSENTNRRASESAYPRFGGRGENYRRQARHSAGSEYSIEQSPLHHGAKAGRGIGAPSPVWDGKGSYESSHGTPGRPRPKHSNRGDESPDRGSAVPKFGEWDDTNPASGEGYTDIFEKVRADKKTAKTPGMVNESPRTNHHKQNVNNDSVKSCCFPWGSK